MRALSILVIDDEPNIRKTLGLSLEALGCRAHTAAGPEDALDEAGRSLFDVALLDLRLGTGSGLDLLPQLLAQSPWMKVVVMTAYASIDTAVQAMRLGAFDYLPKPFSQEELSLMLEKAGRARELERQVDSLKESLGQAEADVLLESRHPGMQRALALARQVAASEATVLLRGENGTGKGVLARAIHGWSRRASAAFATISCPTLSAELFESELFGHARGAFTGAVKDTVGRVAACEGGTLFLDEVGDIPLALQPKLLRLLQERAYERVGEAVSRRADVRLLSATNIDLEAAAKSGRFREDLFYRLNVVQIDLPPLRERLEDLEDLAQSFLGFFSRENRKPGLAFSAEAMERLKAHAWPGNVRELRNAVERAVILCSGSEVLPEHLPPRLGGQAQPSALAQSGDLVSLEELEQAHIRRVLARTRSLEEASQVLDIDAATLWRKRKKYGL
jgi:NtrC-family two-component system response regulator AlgB